MKYIKNIRPSPLVLVVVDGWGVTTAKQSGDPTQQARMPFVEYLKNNYPYALLRAHGHYVGLPNNQDGNSEAGHLNLGAGRVVEQDVVRISNSIRDKSFFKNSALQAAIQHVKARRSTLHLMGLLSNYNSGHSSPDHVRALIELVKKEKLPKVFLHLFTDGRDSPKYDGQKFVHLLEKQLPRTIRIASVVGRFYAMDRKKVWHRTEQTYNLLTRGYGIADTSAEEALRHAYNRGESDEYITPTIMVDQNHNPYGVISEHDSVIFFNLRSDRARQLAKPFIQKNFEQHNPGAFKRWKIFKDVCFVALTDFGPDLGKIVTAFPSKDIFDTLPFSLAHFRQLYIAESEKFAHITYFFNGGYDHLVAGEQRIMIPSPHVSSYDRAPAMSTPLVARTVARIVRSKKYDFIAVNLANADMVGHTGNLNASLKALEVIDKALKDIASALVSRGGTLLVTADHGNIEELINSKTGEVDTEHSKNSVPCFLYSNKLRGKKFLRRSGILADVAPTILSLLRVPKPKSMTGKSLVASNFGL